MKAIHPAAAGTTPAFREWNFHGHFHSHPHDVTTTDMTIVANNGKPFDVRSMSPIFPYLGNTGPTELIGAHVDFRTGRKTILRFILNTFEANIEETFSDIPQSSTCVLRTVAHNTPLEKVAWVEWVEDTQELKVTDLPMSFGQFRGYRE